MWGVGGASWGSMRFTRRHASCALFGGLALPPSLSHTHTVSPSLPAPCLRFDFSGLGVMGQYSQRWEWGGHLGAQCTSLAAMRPAPCLMFWVEGYNIYICINIYIYMNIHLSIYLYLYLSLTARLPAPCLAPRSKEDAHPL